MLAVVVMRRLHAYFAAVRWATGLLTFYFALTGVAWLSGSREGTMQCDRGLLITPLDLCLRDMWTALGWYQQERQAYEESCRHKGAENSADRAERRIVLTSVRSLPRNLRWLHFTAMRTIHFLPAAAIAMLVFQVVSGRANVARRSTTRRQRAEPVDWLAQLGPDDVRGTRGQDLSGVPAAHLASGNPLTDRARADVSVAKRATLCRFMPMSLWARAALTLMLFCGAALGMVEARSALGGLDHRSEPWAVSVVIQETSHEKMTLGYEVSWPTLKAAGRHCAVDVVWLVPAIALLLGIHTAVLAQLRNDRTSCHGCGYSLTGNRSGRCPECGALVPRSAGSPSGAERASE